MARNKITDLNDHLFAQLERLNDETMKAEEMELELKKAKAVSQVASQLIKSNKLTLDAMKLIKDGSVGTGDMPDTFGLKKLEAGGAA